MSSRRAWTSVLLAMLFVLPIIPNFQPARASAPSLSLRPSSARPAQRVSVLGSGFSARTQVALTWADDGAMLAEVLADDAGRFSATITTPDAQPGTHSIVANSAESGTSIASTTLVILASRQSTPRSSATPKPTSTPSATSSATPTKGPATATQAPSRTRTATPQRPTATPAPRTVLFSDIADARVSEASPDVNYGKSTRIRSDGDAGHRTVSYLRFNVTGVGPIAHAVLRLYVTSDGTLQAPAVYGASNDWNELTITWNNRPALATSAIGGGNAEVAHSWVQYDVSSLIAGDGVYTIAISGTSHDGVEFGSRESGRGPQLIVLPATPATQPPATSASTPTATLAPSATAKATATATPAMTRTPTPSATATRQPSSGQAASFVLVGDIMDDILGSDQANHAYTNCAALASEGLPFIALGDTQYDDGAAVLFQQNYAPSKCGAIKNSTHPVVGNHEYQTSGAAGYYGYFGNLASPNQPGCTVDCLGYYAFDAAGGSWRVIVLNTNCDDLAAEHPGDGCAAGTTQEKWLRSQLTAARGNNQNTLVVSHAPRWSSNSQHPSASNGYLQAFWADMVSLGADAWITGHAHDYERFAPQDANGDAAVGGLVEIVVGAGGEMDQGLIGGCNDGPSGSCAANTAALNHLNVGYLKITLASDGLTYSFVPTVQLFGGAPFHDSGVIALRP